MNMYEQIYAVVNNIPYGKVASYSQVGRMVGLKNGARLVGWAMRSLPAGTTVPWWRVINMKRQISIVNRHIPKSEQARLLEEEGLIISEVGGWFVVQGNEWADLYCSVNLFRLNT